MVEKADQLLADTLHEQIPISKAMGVEVTQANEKSVILKAPLEPNINHKLTAFGGSLNTLSVLACWSMIFLRLRHHGIDAHIVIQSSSVEYLRPVTHALEAVCSVEEEKAFEKMLRMFEKHRKGRITLEATIYEEEIPAVRFKGSYVIHT